MYLTYLSLLWIRFIIPSETSPWLHQKSNFFMRILNVTIIGLFLWWFFVVLFWCWLRSPFQYLIIYFFLHFHLSIFIISYYVLFFSLSIKTSPKVWIWRYITDNLQVHLCMFTIKSEIHMILDIYIFYQCWTASKFRTSTTKKITNIYE